MTATNPPDDTRLVHSGTRSPEYVTTGELENDVVLLTAFVRASADKATDHAIHIASVRKARERFLAQHVNAIYDALTEGRRRWVKLGDLLLAAAERYPSLVPGSTEVLRDSCRRQSEKRGLEIDQAIFVRAIINSEPAGNHLIESMLTPVTHALELLGEFQRNGRVVLETVVLERRDCVGHVTIANLDCLNAEDVPLLRDMETAVDLAILDPKIKVGVLRGAAMTHPRYVGRRVFSSGLNLKALRDGRIPVVGFLVARELGLINKLRCGLVVPDRCGLSRSYIEKPWIAAVDGFAIGGGMQLLLAVDSVVASQDSTFSLPASREGFVPGAANMRLARFVGARLARKLILGGTIISASEPDAALLCDIVVPAGEMDSAISEVAIQLSSEAALANRHALIRAEESPADLRRYLGEFAVLQAVRMHSKDVIDAVEAFNNTSPLDRRDTE
ncbi:enoyl-CoA hydratase/isomerase family protein [Bradyrhizobium oligotrophicum]|uniref:enoyl-CoA hydratase/isomerase family protein n=1 Tax=Bradyrhizobium oligotrophicum TaxID=44255 RepID=UPI003EBA517D